MTSQQISERTYPDDQGYGMTQLHDFGGSRVRVVVKVGYQLSYTSAKVQRWDGQQWQKVVEAGGEELAEMTEKPPSYVCFAHTDRDFNNRSMCEDWLAEAAEYVLAFARQVLGE